MARGRAWGAVLLVVVLSAAAGAGGPAPEVPTRYRELHGGLTRALDGWEGFMARRPAGGERPVWAGELLVANANRGEELVRPGAIEGVRLFLDRFASLGLDGVTVSVNYPLMDPDFPRARDYEAFYREVAREVRLRKLTLDVESGVLFANTAFSQVRYDYGALSWDRFVRGRRAHTEAILRSMSPDFLNIGAEPDTEARLAGKERLNDPEGRAEMIRTILSGLDRGRTRMAAGIGTWGDTAFVRAYLSSTDLDAIALHVYPVGRRTLATTYEAIEMARQARKPVLVDECWLYKAGPGEGQGIAANESVFQRDLWSFWAPLDQRFLGLVDRFARQEGVVFVSPFWSHQYFAYLEYDPSLDGRPYREVNARYLRQVRAAAEGGGLSTTGDFLRRMLGSDRP
ncbi:MAG TPA: hypothetical protein VE359_23070 [Vicinamibacteria bacterium]|nr:hypothetical protein [Vicinamibacteria bacterium]